MEILAYQVCGSWSNNISITYDTTSETDRAEVDKFISRIIPEKDLPSLAHEEDIGEKEPD